MKFLYLLFNNITLSIFCFTTLVVSGCAIVDQKIELNYSLHDISSVKHSGNIMVSRFVPHPFSKNNRSEWIIGSLNNVNGVHQADLLSDRSPEEWITDALIKELRQAGYTVKYTTSLPATAVHGIAITNIKADLTVNQGTVSTDTKQDLQFDLEIFLNGNKIKTFTVNSRNSITRPLNFSKEEEESIMLQSLQDAMQQTISGVITQIDKK